MSKIDDLISPKKEITFRGEKYNIEAGFNLEEAPIITAAFGGKTIEEKSEGLKKLLKLILLKIYPTATEAQLAKVDLKYTTELMEIFNQINESDVDEKKEIKETLEKANQ